MTAFVIILAYLLGSIPSGIWIGKYFYHTDIRKLGSGNSGTTNTYRVLGKKAGTVVLIMDILKGSIATLLPMWFGLSIHPFSSVSSRQSDIRILFLPVLKEERQLPQARVSYWRTIRFIFMIANRLLFGLSLFFPDGQSLQHLSLSDGHRRFLFLPRLGSDHRDSFLDDIHHLPSSFEYRTDQKRNRKQGSFRV